MRLVATILLLSMTQLCAQNKSEAKLLEISSQKLHDGKWDEALRYVNQVLATNPALTDAYLLRANIHEKLGNENEALTDYSIAIDLSPQSPEVYLNRAVLAYKLKRFDLAKADFGKLLSTETSETNTVYFSQSDNGGYDKIFTTQSRIRDLIYNYLGLIETQLDQYETGILYFDSAIAVNPHNADYFAHRGQAFLKSGNKEKAIQNFYFALKLNPEHSISRNNLAAIKQSEGSIDEAEKLLQEAKQGNTQSANHHSDLGLLLLGTGRYKEAILNFDTAIAIEPVDGELYVNRGLAKEKTGDFTGAMRDFEVALLSDPKWPKAWFVQGNNFMKQGMLEQALENYTVAISYDEEYALAYYNRAIVQYKLGEIKNACSDIRIAESKGITVDSKMRSKFCGE